MNISKCKIPENWKFKNIGEIVTLEYGFGLPEKKRKDGPYPVFGSNGIVGFHNEGFISSPGIVIGRKGSIGKVNYTSLDFCPIDTTYYLINKENNNWKWLFSILSISNLENLNSATGVPGLNRNDVYNLKIPIPPTNEQNKIASILSTVDDLIENTTNLINSYSLLKKGLMQTLLTKGIGHTRFKKTEIGEIPEDWEIKKVGEICKSGRGRVISLKEIKNNPGKFPVFSSQSKEKGCMGYLNKYDFNGEYVTWTTDGVYAGTTFYRSGKFNCTNVCGTLKSKVKNIDIKYLSLALGRQTGKYVVKLGNSKLMNNIIEIIPIPIPTDIKEQREIGKIIQMVEDIIDINNIKKNYLNLLKKGLMQQLLTGKIRVEV